MCHPMFITTPVSVTILYKTTGKSSCLINVNVDAIH